MNQELRQGLRSLVRHPGFSLTAIVTLALGVGASAAVFAVAWHLLLKPLPWPDADRIVQVWNTFKKTAAINVLAPANYFDIEREARSFEAVAAYNFFPHTLIQSSCAFARSPAAISASSPANRCSDARSAMKTRGTGARYSSSARDCGCAASAAIRASREKQ